MNHSLSNKKLGFRNTIKRESNFYIYRKSKRKTKKNTLVVSKVHSSTPVPDVLMYLLSHNVALEAFKM